MTLLFLLWFPVLQEGAGARRMVAFEGGVEALVVVALWAGRKGTS